MISAVDASRLEVVALYVSHRKSIRHTQVAYESSQSWRHVQEQEVVYKTMQASPLNHGLIAKREIKGPIGAKAAYLIRDTMKVLGHSEAFPWPI